LFIGKPKGLLLLPQFGFTASLKYYFLLPQFEVEDEPEPLLPPVLVVLVGVAGVVCPLLPLF
jgi:hypothetical protein